MSQGRTLSRLVSETGQRIEAALELSVDISHSWIGDFAVSLRSPAGTDVMLHNGEGGSSDNLIRTFTTATTPALATLAGQPAGGTWRLKIVDVEDRTPESSITGDSSLSRPCHE